MAEEPSAVKPTSARELRTEFNRTRARISMDVDEIEKRLRTRVHAVVGTGQSPQPETSMSLRDAVRLVNVLAGAVAGFAVMRLASSRRHNQPDAWGRAKEGDVHGEKGHTHTRGTARTHRYG